MVIDRTHALEAMSGGYAVVLMTRDARENPALCAAYRYRLAPVVSVRPYDWRAHELGVVARAVYWPVRSVIGLAGAAPPTCARLLAAYDFDRARALMGTLKLEGPGPFLVVVNSGPKVAGFTRLGVFDLHRIPRDEIPSTLGAFSDYFAQSATLWKPDLIRAALVRQHLKVLFDDDLAPRVAMLIGLTNSASAAERER